MMKEVYIAPEVKLVCFEANEKLATVIDFDDLGALENGCSSEGGLRNPAEPSGNDIHVGA